MQKKKIYSLLFLPSVLFLSSCIDEDTSDCPPFSKEVVITYQLEVAEDVDQGFSSDINSLHLGFWDTPLSLHTDQLKDKSEFPDDLVFRVTLPVNNYSHIAVANSAQHDGTFNTYPDKIADAVYRRNYVLTDTVFASVHPAYAGNLVMNMGMNYEDETYKVVLTAVSSKYVIRVNHPSSLKNIRCYISGIKQGHSCWDRTWVENDKLVTDASAHCKESTGEASCFSFYAFPTAETAATKADGTQEGWWKLYFYSELENKTIQHIFTVKQPVAPGQVFDATFSLTEQGGEAVDVDAGVEFDPDWKPGNDFDIDI